MDCWGSCCVSGVFRDACRGSLPLLEGPAPGAARCCNCCSPGDVSMCAGGLDATAPEPAGLHSSECQSKAPDQQRAACKATDSVEALLLLSGSPSTGCLRVFASSVSLLSGNRARSASDRETEAFTGQRDESRHATLLALGRRTHLLSVCFGPARTSCRGPPFLPGGLSAAAACMGPPVLHLRFGQPTPSVQAYSRTSATRRSVLGTTGWAVPSAAALTALA